MVKAKKGRKLTEENSNDDTSPVEGVDHMDEMEDSDVSEPRPPKPEQKKKGKGKKGKQKQASDSDDEQEAIPAPAKGGFALLMADDDDDDDSENEVSQPIDDEDISDPEPIIQSKSQEKGGKKSKKGKKKKDEDDEDIDKVLAELELEYSGQRPKDTVAEEETEADDKKETKKAKKKERRREAAAIAMDVNAAEENVHELDNVDEETSTTAKTANQKKKDKKKDKKKEKKEETPNEGDEGDDAGDDDEEDNKKGKKKKKGKDDKDAKGPGKKTIAAMQEALKKIKEEEERMIVEEEERIRREDEEDKQRAEAARLEKERKEKKKQKEKERKERLKAEGKLLTAKQKQDKARAQELINSLKAQGLELPEPGEKKVRPGTRIKPSKKPSPQQPPVVTPQVPNEQNAPVAEVEVVIVDQAAAAAAAAQPPPPVESEVKEAWDAESSGDEAQDTPTNEHPLPESPKKSIEPATEPKAEKQISVEKSVESSDEEEDEGSSEESESNDDEDVEEEERKTEPEKKRERALARIQKRKDDAEKRRSIDNLRAAVVCVLGHVDTGKTKILDKLRRTNVQIGEAGGITQQIGATNVPMDNIRDNCKLVKGFSEMTIKLPGLLIIDTPGHESFSNLRSRGSSLCDIAILVVDIMHGLEPQTIESINLLKARKTPFIVALNKIDRLYDWQTMGRKDVRDIIKAQAENTQTEFQQRTKEVVLQFAEQGLNAALYYDSPDVRSYVSLVPTSAITGEGMGNLLSLIVEFCQTMLAKRLMYSELLQATVLEVKQIPGLGTTIDCILINGKIAEGDTIILAGTDGPVVTQIRSLLMPQPMKELRVKNAYIEYKEVKAAQGIKIAGKDLEKAIAGLNLQVAEKPDEVEIYCEDVARELKSALSNIKLKERGVYVQASTLGSLEALLEFLRTSKIPVSNIRIGPVVKKDVMKASIMLEHESQYATILAFDVKIERDAQELADSLGVKIFQADIIYHLFDKFMAYREELRQKKREEFKNIAVFPCRLRILPQFVFNSRDPIVCGVIIESGIVKEGTPLCVPSKEFLYIGTVSSVEQNHKQVESARKGMEVCIKIENTTGEAPKLYGRHFDHTDVLTSKISRQSIDACKDYFREDLTKADWQLMVDLKKLFQIM